MIKVNKIKKLLLKVVVFYFVVFISVGLFLFKDKVSAGSLIVNKPIRHEGVDLDKVVYRNIIAATSGDKSKIVELPLRIEIQSVNINLEVIEGTYNSGTWSLSTDKVHFASMTAVPNNIKGNTLIYGHNTKQVLLNTKNLKPGDELYLFTENYIFKYIYSRDKLVQPSDTEIITIQSGPQVTLLTCNGWNDKYRRLMFFEFKEVIPKS